MIRTNTVLELKNLSYIFPDHKGITDVSLKIKQGEIYMLYGGHDAGKTLLLQMLIGTLIPQMGTIKLFGNSNYLQEKRRIGYVPQEPYCLGKMSALDMLRYFALSYGVLEKDFDKVLDLSHVEKSQPAICLCIFRKDKFGDSLIRKTRSDFIG